MDKYPNLKLNPENPWSYTSGLHKRFSGFISYMTMAICALFAPVEVDKAVYVVLKDQFIDDETL